MSTNLRPCLSWLIVLVGMLFVGLGAYQGMAQDTASEEDDEIPANCTPVHPAGWVIYVIQANDTLSGIAARTGSRVQELARVNCITNRRLIATGAEIFVPLPIDDNNPIERCRLAGIEPERCRALLFGDHDNLAERCRLAGIEPERCRALFGDNDNNIAERCRLAGLEPERCRALVFGDDDNLTERCRLTGIEPERCRALLFGDDDSDINNSEDGRVENRDDSDVNNVDDGDANDQDEGDIDDVNDGNTDDVRGRGGDDN